MKLIQLVVLMWLPRIGNNFSTKLWKNMPLLRNNEFLQLGLEKKYHQTRGRKTRSQYHWQMYRKLPNHINRLEKRLKSEHICRMIEEAKNDSSRTWKCLKDALPQSANHSVSVIKSGKKAFLNQFKSLKCLTNISQL